MIRFLGVGVTGSCELPDMGGETRTQILWGSRFLNTKYLCSPRIVNYNYRDKFEFKSNSSLVL